MCADDTQLSALILQTNQPLRDCLYTRSVAEVGKRLVGFCHSVCIFTLFDR
jgi:hypothetical protein